MASNSFTEGVRPGGLTTSKEIRILLCYLLDYAGGQARREDLEEVLTGEELANYFVLAESLTQLAEQNLITEEADGTLHITEAGHTVARTLSQDLPRTVRDTAVRGVIRAQQYAAKKAAHQSEIVTMPNGRCVQCSIGDETGQLFRLELYMPSDLTAEAVRRQFIERGDDVYKLVLAALTDNRELAQKALENLQQ